MPARDQFGQFARLKGKGAFATNLETLATRVEGRWTGHVLVDQVYAHYQHAHLEFRHPRGGQALYLQVPLYRHYRRYYGILAREAITSEGTNLRGGYREVVEHLSAQVYLLAPREFHDLRQSGHPYVTRDGKKVYDRKPLVGRLSEQELQEKSHLRYLLHQRRIR